MRAGLVLLLVLLVPWSGEPAASAWATHEHAPGAGSLLEPARDPAPWPLACARPDEPATRLVYARPTDAPDRAAAMAPRVVAMAEKANGLVHEDAAALGANVSLRARCGADGRPEVAVAVVPRATSFAHLRESLRAQGFASELDKYAVWYDGKVGAYGGQGLWREDDRPGPENLNNAGATFSVVYGVATDTSYALWLHEHLHSMGAVQLSAPHATPGHHCTDGRDVMCEVEDPDVGYETVCPRLVLDCHADDYFHPYPAEGSYLASHWNVASRANRWLHFGNEFPRALTFACEARALEPVRCAFAAQDDGGAVAYVVSWGDGSATRVPEEGFLPAGEPQHAERRFTGLREVRVTAVDPEGETASASILLLSL